MKRLLIVTFAMAIALSASSLDAETLVGLWRFDDGAGDTAEDASGNGNDATLMNGPTWVGTDWGMGLEFVAGDASYVIAPVPHSNTVTVVMWAQYSALPSANPGLLHAQATDADEGPPESKIIGIWVEQTNLLWGRIIPPGAGNVNLPKSKQLDADTWFHTAMVIDEAAGEATQWVDGEQVGEAAFPGDLGPYAFLKIGRQGTETWEGVIDEVAFFHAALTEDDIRSIMDNGFDGALSVEANDKLTTTWAEMKTR